MFRGVDFKENKKYKTVHQKSRFLILVYAYNPKIYLFPPKNH